MEGLGIELPWMFTVVGVMFAYGVITVIGVLKNRSAREKIED